MANFSNIRAEVEYNRERRAYHVVVYLDGQYLAWEVNEHTFKITAPLVNEVSELRERNHKLEAENETLRSDMTTTIQTIKDKFEETIEHERQLRAEAEEQLKYLQNEVLEFRGNLQRRDESYSGYTGTPISFEDYAWNDVQPPSTSVRTVSGTTFNTTLPASGTNPSGDWGTTLNHTIQLLCERDD